MGRGARKTERTNRARGGSIPHVRLGRRSRRAVPWICHPSWPNPAIEQRLGAFFGLTLSPRIVPPLALLMRWVFRAPRPTSRQADTPLRFPHSLTSCCFSTDSRLPNTTARVFRLSSMLGSGCWPRSMLSMKCSSKGNRRSCTASSDMSSCVF